MTHVIIADICVEIAGIIVEAVMWEYTNRICAHADFVNKNGDKFLSSALRRCTSDCVPVISGSMHIGGALVEYKDSSLYCDLSVLRTINPIFYAVPRFEVYDMTKTLDGIRVIRSCIVTSIDIVENPADTRIERIGLGVEKDE